MRPIRSWLLLGLVGAGCGGGGAKAPDAGTTPDASADAATPATAVFAPPVPGSGADWGVMPFPSDLYLDSAGLLTLNSFPTGLDLAVDMSFAASMKSTLHTMDGAGVWSNVYFPVTGGDIDPATLAGHVKYVDLDRALAEVPADVLWRGDLGAIVLAPKLGVILTESHHYAAYVTSAVKTVGGAALAPSPVFQTVATAGERPAIATLGAAYDSLHPLLTALGADAASVVSATVFRTEHVTRVAKAMRDLVAATPPTITVLDVKSTPAELDAVFGAQSPTAPPGGISGDYRNQPHGNVRAVIQGTIGLTSFVNATVTEQGFTTFDTGGQPMVKGTLTAKWTLILPIAASYANLPVMLNSHGITDTRIEMLKVADDAAAKGIATIAIDLIYHGDRALAPVDVINEITGVQGPDGFGDSGGLLSATSFFHLVASAGVSRAHPEAMRDNLRQAAIDLCSVVSFVQGGSVAPINTALAAKSLPADLSFRKTGIALRALSFGSMVGAIALAVEPNLKVASMSVLAAGFPYPELINSPTYSPSFAAVIYHPFGVAIAAPPTTPGRVILGDPLYGARFDPITSLWDMAEEQGDPAAYAPYILPGTLRGGAGPSVVMSEAYSDESVANDSTEHFAGALGVPRVMMPADPMPAPPPGNRYVALPQAQPPMSGNINANQTAGLQLFNPASHGMSDTYQDYSKEQPNFPPFVMRPAAINITNPIVAEHRVWSSFFADFFAGRTPKIIESVRAMSLITVGDYARAARGKLSDVARRYFRSGSDAQRTLRANRQAYRHYELWYRVLCDVSERSLATTVLGTPVAFPILVAPTAYHKLAHPDGEIGVARAAAAVGTIFTLSTLATTRLEDVAAASTGPRWFQLYVHKDRGLTRSLVERAAAAGYSALVLTVDTPVLGRRVRDERHGFALPAGMTMANLVDAPGFAPPAGSALSAYVASRHDPSLTWKDVAWLRKLSPLPVVIKGIVRADDARRAALEGAAAIIVSNHGGRQMDSAPGTLDALPGCCDAVAGRCEVLMDGGIRWGTDVVKALGLGARAVLVGRPILWGLAVGGEAGARAVLELLQGELSRAMALAGCASLAAIDRDLVRRRML